MSSNKTKETSCF